MALFYARRNKLFVDGSPYEMGSGETEPLTVDITQLLDAAQTPATPTSTLINLATGAAYAGGLSGAASVSGNRVTQSITALAANTNYRLTWGFTAVAGTIHQVALDINCRF